MNTCIAALANTQIALICVRNILMLFPPLIAVLMVFFERPVYVVREDDRVAVVTVRASEPHALPFIVTAVATDGSAIGSNYSSSSVVFKCVLTIANSPVQLLVCFCFFMSRAKTTTQIWQNYTERLCSTYKKVYICKTGGGHLSCCTCGRRYISFIFIIRLSFATGHHY